MLYDEFTSTPVVHRDGCYICEDPEFAQMGLPLCRLCPACKTGHVAADDTVCDDCGADDQAWWERRWGKVSDRGTVRRCTEARRWREQHPPPTATASLQEVTERLRAAIERDRA
jgi:hypothetical protein